MQNEEAFLATCKSNQIIGWNCAKIVRLESCNFHSLKSVKVTTAEHKILLMLSYYFAPYWRNYARLNNIHLLFPDETWKNQPFSLENSQYSLFINSNNELSTHDVTLWLGTLPALAENNLLYRIAQSYQRT